MRRTLAQNIAWQPFSGLVSAMTYGNGLTEADSYSLDYEVNRLLLQNGPTSLIDRTHAHVDKLNLTGITDAVTPANSQTFSYSAANRLSTASGVYGSYGWSYDGVGNRTQETLGTATNVCAYPPASNRLTTIASGATTLRAFTYDPNGNTLSDTRSGVAYAYTHNQNNRLKTVTVAGNLKATYTYNAAEQLAVRVLTNMTPSGAIHDVYDRDGNLLMESNGLSTGITREYIWLPGTEIAPATDARAGVPRPIAVVDAVNTATPATWWVHTDHLNRPVQMTDGSKATVWQATWLPFGAPQAITGTATLDARFPGQWFQLESGLHQNWWRHYDPTTGRYTQPDPLGFVDGPSVYGYAKQRPTGKIDQSGRMVFPGTPNFGPPATNSCTSANPSGGSSTSGGGGDDSSIFEDAGGPLTVTPGGTTIIPGTPGLDPTGLSVGDVPLVQQQDIASTLQALMDGNIGDLNMHPYRNFPNKTTGAVLPGVPGTGGYMSFNVLGGDGAARILLSTTNGNLFYTNTHYQSYYPISIK